MLSSSFRQVRFEAMENNRKLGEELRALRAEYLPRLAKLIEFSREKGVQKIAESLLAAREVILSEQPEATLATEARKRKLDPILLQRWVAHVRQAATNQSNPLHLFAKYSLVRDATVPGGALGTAPRRV